MMSINTEVSERRTTETGRRGHFRQLGEGVGLHLLHHPAAVGFCRDFAETKLAPTCLFRRPECGAVTCGCRNQRRGDQVAGW